MGKGALAIFSSAGIGEYATTSYTMGEVREYIPSLSRLMGIGEQHLLSQLLLLPLTIYERQFYDRNHPEAMKRISERDPDDVEILALALTLEAPLWSNDKDFEAAGIEWMTTKDMFAFIKK
jgi:predicted nucleic acid-binding protein